MCVRITIQELFDVYSESEGTDLPLQAMYLFVQQPLWDAQPLQPDPESSAGAGAARLRPFVSAAHSVCEGHSLWAAFGIPWVHFPDRLESQEPCRNTTGIAVTPGALFLCM